MLPVGSGFYGKSGENTVWMFDISDTQEGTKFCCVKFFSEVIQTNCIQEDSVFICAAVPGHYCFHVCRCQTVGCSDSCMEYDKKRED